MSGRKRGNAIVREEPRDASIEARSIAREAARAHQMSLASGTPSVVISMVPSHVYRVFWLNLPRRFCDGNLPETKSKLTLEDEEGNEFTVVFIPERYGLSGGWVSFAREKKLHDGDAVVLEQIEKTRLKVSLLALNTNIIDLTMALPS
ncbi:putative transcription factor B3-Domain family [Rosa chinensis]|uniref:Putative transcription factor B3-Domain family n=1 Tax=Rosa chinensis TaxID=74649 RepID=A0A2P6PYW8_ROSCH|nr:putative transcription factor B3-Domain family [Rosa chinensis]